MQARANMFAQAKSSVRAVVRSVSTVNPEAATAAERGIYTKELHHAVEAVKLASRLCKVRMEARAAWQCCKGSYCAMQQVVQQQLSTSEKVDKPDDSPVTVADYGNGQPQASAASASIKNSTWGVLPDSENGKAISPPPPTNQLVPYSVVLFSGTSGAQVVVAWSLSRSDPGSRLSMIAEEDSASLR